jgi:hypothetical protein
MKPTKTDEEMRAAAEEHADDPDRAELLQRARRFKASWIELAEALTDVRRRGQWKNWGYDTFEAYAKGELHLRQETVDKLTGSFLFLQRRAPDVLKRDGVQREIPSYQAVDFLRRAEEREDAPSDAVRAVRERVIEEGAPLSAVSRQFKDVVFPMSDGDKRTRDAAAVKNVATRLRELLGETKVVPRKIAGDAVEAIERVLEALAASEEKAA